MLKRVELWNWESHEHTVLEDFDPGFNLIFGESNAGKTAIIRAIKLVAYNEFDPKSVRVGAKTCVVEIETERGVVKVERGKGVNIWHVTGLAKPLINVGKKPVPEAQEILGMRMVELGDVSVPVNIMGQTESHFLLCGLGNKDASGSIRAQVVDEISGLSGIEGLIKDVSLDNHRWGREIKQWEDRTDELRGEMNDAAMLKAEQMLLEQAKKHIDARDECTEAVEVLSELLTEHAQASRAMMMASADLAILPDPEALEAILNMVGVSLGSAEKAQAVWELWNRAADYLTQTTETLAGLPDEAKAEEAIERATKATTRADAAYSLATTYHVAVQDQEAAQHDMDVLEHEEAEAAKELADATGQFSICPLTLEPIGDKCMANIRIPVTDEAEAERILKEKGVV